MNTCPKCGSEVEDKTTVCECGSMLFGEVTNIHHGWETETVFPPATLAKRKWLPTISVAVVVLVTLLALAWPRIQQNLTGPQSPDANEPNTVSQNPTRSDIVPSDDLVVTETTAQPISPEGAFEFSQAAQVSKTNERNNSARTIYGPGDTLSPVNTSLDTQLLVESAENKTKQATDGKEPADCKPEITFLKRPEPESSVSESKVPAKPAGGYILGPRGGCFVVTASGGKKYVDRALCSATTAAARQ